MATNKQRLVWLAAAGGLGFFVGGRWNIALAAWLMPIFAIRYFRTSDRPWRDLARSTLDAFPDAPRRKRDQ